MDWYKRQEYYELHKNLFREFLDKKFADTKNDYKEKVRTMCEEGRIRLIVNLNDFLQFDKVHYRNLLRKPHEYIPSFQDALYNYIQYDPDLELKSEEYFVGFEGTFGGNKVSPRSLTTSYLRSLVCVEGIVTKLSSVRPKLVQSVHYCPATKKHMVKHHRDATTLFGLPTTPVYPQRDEKGNLLQTEFGMSVFKDYQTLHLQEMPERAPPGQLPRSVEVILENDLVDRVKPGDRVRIMGVYRALPKVFTAQKTKGIFQTILLANNLQLINEEIKGPVLTAKDVQNIKEFAKNENAFELLSQSLAPSIYGHNIIKKALLLQLLGGVEKDLKSSGIHLRGDINILLVGDPGTAKSQLLRFILHVAPLSISTTGRGASGVGLTAAVVHDKETGERRLEAGAMVLADRGIVCIDEFDKMSVEDRVAIHEVMEQQTVTIAKAGIHASLNARCSVLGAANPLYGKYDRSKQSSENINMPDSLLSRFDLLFVVLDNLDPVNDRKVSEHVLKMHCYKTSEELESLHEDEDDMDGIGRTSPVFISSDKYTEPGKKICSIPFIKKYIMYAKNEIKPVLNEEAQMKIVDAFSELRAREDTKTLPVTARQLETMIRLSVAHAKCRLSKEVELKDVNAALQIIRYALYNDTSSLENQNEEIESKDSESHMDLEENNNDQVNNKLNKEEQENVSMTVDNQVHNIEDNNVSINQDRVQLVISTLSTLFESNKSEYQVDELKNILNIKVIDDELFSDRELQEILIKIDKEGLIYYDQDTKTIFKTD